MPLFSNNSTAVVIICLILIVSPACVRQSEKTHPQEPKEEKTEILIAAVGDIMMPISIQKAVARNKYKYDILFEKIAQELALADIVFANLESPVDHTASVSGYPKFNARPDLVGSLKTAGFGIVSIANNHALDAGTGGLKRTIENIEAAGLLFTGAGRTNAEAEQATMMTAQGITTAFFAYTYGTNAHMPRKKGRSSARVNILRNGNEKDLSLAAAAVQKARQSADLVVVSLHWGDEYGKIPTKWQRRAGAELIEAGADIILGHHPHVLQPIESYTARSGRQGLIAFSLGNFISSQNYGVTNKNRTQPRALRGDGIILNIFAVKEKGETSIVRAEFIPIWTLRERIGKTVVNRPVSLAREIGRLEAIQKRTTQDENTLKLLTYRKKFIIDQLTVSTVP